MAMDNDTDVGGAAAVFPATQCSLVRAAASRDPAVRKEAQENLIAAYWKPIYKYIRLKWNAINEDAKDWTQAFFVLAMEKGFFDRFDPTRARFRTFVRLCVDGFVANEQRAARRLKRGGQQQVLSLDFEGADGELCHQRLAPGTDPDDILYKEWVRSLFALAVEDLGRHCEASDRKAHFALFERYDLEGPESAALLTYARLAKQFGLSETQVTNYLAYARRQFRQCLLGRLRAATGSDEEFQEEVQRLFGGPLG
jgi:RNA polymerase sigma factor (sigma-70 family)